ncbi:MAG TPA: class I SAM-dependent methyltransferase [Solirubrobacteraceae bacterium]|nr:class I SAM-dependent methyltransferase [Solirubrobacteraceae bacterium]
MLEQSASLISERLDADAFVLDVGGAARPFSRADWVLDLAPYDARGQLGWVGDPSKERFTAETWVQRDICDREPWPFQDRQFDFAICSHTLEDVRDPVWVAQELQRVATAGYIEVPSLREELTYGIQGPWVGWGHHHWLVLVGEGSIEFLFKHHVVNRQGSHLPEGAMSNASPMERVQMLWWEGSFSVQERFMLTADELDGFLAEQASGWRSNHLSRPRGRPRWLRRQTSR